MVEAWAISPANGAKRPVNFGSRSSEKRSELRPIAVCVQFEGGWSQLVLKDECARRWSRALLFEELTSIKVQIAVGVTIQTPMSKHCGGTEAGSAESWWISTGEP